MGYELADMGSAVISEHSLYCFGFVVTYHSYFWKDGMSRVLQLNRDGVFLG